MTQEERIQKAAENMAQNLYDYAKRGREPEYNRYDEGYLDAIELQGSFLVKEGIEWALQNQWTSVDDELPKEDGVYLIMINSKTPTINPFDVKKQKWGLFKDNVVTHWMEIPKLVNIKK